MTNNCRNDVDPLPQRVVSERLLIRPTTRADAPFLKQWWNDPAVTESSGSMTGMQYDDEDIEDWFVRYVDGRDCHTHFIISLRGENPASSDHPIGEFYIASDDRPGCIGIALVIGDTRRWGQGYATEALQDYAQALFNSNLCEAIRMDISVKNHGARRMCQKAGFEVEHVWANGQFQTMILTAEAFRQKQQAAHK